MAAVVIWFVCGAIRHGLRYKEHKDDLERWTRNGGQSSNDSGIWSVDIPMIRNPKPEPPSFLLLIVDLALGPLALLVMFRREM